MVSVVPFPLGGFPSLEFRSCLNRLCVAWQIVTMQTDVFLSHLCSSEWEIHAQNHLCGQCLCICHASDFLHFLHYEACNVRNCCLFEDRKEGPSIRKMREGVTHWLRHFHWLHIHSACNTDSCRCWVQKGGGVTEETVACPCLHLMAEKKSLVCPSELSDTGVVVTSLYSNCEGEQLQVVLT